MTTLAQCPVCGKEMVKRKGKFGEFYGCSGYPECAHTMPLTSSRNANSEMQKRASVEFNKFILQRGMTQAQAARWLQQTLGLNWDEARINMLNDKQCEILLAYIKFEGGTETQMQVAFKKAQARKKK